MHMFTAFYFVIVLSLEKAWQLPYHELIELWTLGAFLVGAAALPAGWLSDRWSPVGMLAIFFIGLGASAVWASTAESPQMLMYALSGIGLFAAIYHPVGIPWLLKHSSAATRGRLQGIHGIFGSMGAGLAALIAGALIEAYSWRAAFLLPGIIALTFGLALFYLRHKGRLGDGPRSAQSSHRLAKADLLRAFGLLLFTMTCAGLIYHSTQTALPKLFAGRLATLVGGSAFGIGALVASVYMFAGLMQVLGGMLADRFPLKLVYLVMLALQIPLLAMSASAGGWALVIVVTLMVMFAASALPAENLLLGHYAPAKHHGFFFGLKFVLSFGIAPLAVQAVAWVQGTYADFFWLFMPLAVVAALASMAAVLLPGNRSSAAASAQS